MTAFDHAYLAAAKASAPAWRADAMQAAFDVFESLAEPTGVEEDWRYVNYDAPFSRFEPATGPVEPLPAGPFLASVGETSGHVLIADGRVIQETSQVASVKRFSELPAQPANGLVPADHNKLAAAHAAFATDGVVVELPANKVMSTPLIVEIQAVAPGSASFPHLVVKVGKNAEAQILVVYRSAEGAELLVVPEVDLHVGNGGRLRYLAVQGLDSAATGVVHQRVVLQRDATVKIGEVGLGGKLARLDLGISLVGDGSSSEVVGLYFGEGDQTLDYRMVITHEGKSTSSNVFLKGAVEDSAQSVFTGLLRIERDARRTSTFETNRNLVLSENAKAHSVPNLEILCDDVVCGHASSVGPLEDGQLYYLQSRGLRRPRAERLLIRGFFQEVIDRLPIDGVEKPVSKEVLRRFVTAQEEGRVS